MMSLALIFLLSLKTCSPLAVTLRQVRRLCWVFVLPILLLHTRDSYIRPCKRVRVTWVDSRGGGTHLGSQPLCVRTPLEKVCRGHELALNSLVKSR